MVGTSDESVPEMAIDLGNFGQRLESGGFCIASVVAALAREARRWGWQGSFGSSMGFTKSRSSITWISWGSPILGNYFRKAS